MSNYVVNTFNTDLSNYYSSKGMALKAIAKALTRSEESVKARAKEDGLSIAKLH